MHRCTRKSIIFYFLIVFSVCKNFMFSLSLYMNFVQVLGQRNCHVAQPKSIIHSLPSHIHRIVNHGASILDALLANPELVKQHTLIKEQLIQSPYLLRKPVKLSDPGRGCPGYTYGVWVIAHLAGDLRRSSSSSRMGATCSPASPRWFGPPAMTRTLYSIFCKTWPRLACVSSEACRRQRRNARQRHGAPTPGGSS
uniref:Uncharacterized protein n=1 Tax=Oryza brachyantha TaxID=4533 RepID=J3MZD9_ORYBR